MGSKNKKSKKDIAKSSKSKKNAAVQQVEIAEKVEEKAQPCIDMKILQDKIIWLHYLYEGVVLICDEKILFMNERAAEFLQVDIAHIENLSLLAILRDHRLEQVYRDKAQTRIETRGRVLEARGMAEGLLLRDVSSEERVKENARELLAVLSHELRTPVTILRSTIEALNYDLSKSQQKHFLERAEAEGARLTRLLDDLTVDVKPPKMRRLSLKEHLERALAIVQDSFKRHQVTPLDNLPKQEDFTIWADADKFVQVLVNLLENAAVHGPDNAQIAIVVQAQDNGMLHISVCDQGEPLDDALMEELFEPHSRGGSKAKGTGLGLYIVRSIAQRWEGEAWGRACEHYEERGFGNEFGFSVPLRT